MGTVRLNITLPAELVHELERLSEPRQKSQFIAEALKQKIEKLRHEELQKNLEEGYKARKQESHSIAKGFESVDLEGWDEY
jgi:metal-responsive CopG/Arc/MetJ family transcriptional regulator